LTKYSGCDKLDTHGQDIVHLPLFAAKGVCACLDGRLRHLSELEGYGKMMISGFRRSVWTVFAVVLLLSGGLPATVVALGETPQRGEQLAAGFERGTGVQQRGAAVELQAATAERVILELDVPDFVTEEVRLGGQQYVVLSAPGLGDAAIAGQPRLPQTGVLVGLPPKGGWSLRVLETERRLVKLSHRVAPAPTKDGEPAGPAAFATAVTPSWVIDESIYTEDAFYPSSPVEMEGSTLFRDLRVGRLGIHPLRYNPARGELEHIQRLVVEIRFDQPAPGIAPVLDAWDSILGQAVINYDVARGWRGVRSSFTHAAQNPPATRSGSFKVEVDADGLYQVTYDALKAAGFPVATANPQNLHLVTGGEEVAIRVEVGFDGRFTPGDRILFYGQAARGRFTRVNIYWLYTDDNPGLRMSSRSVIPYGVYPMPSARWITTHFEENHLYDEIRPEADGDHWYWSDLSFMQVECNNPGGFWQQEFDVPHLWGGGHSVTLRINLQGRTWSRHHLKVWVNDHLLGHIVWLGQDREEAEFTFSAGWLSQTGNDLILENGSCPPPPPPVPEPNGMTINYFEVDHLAGYRALGDVLEFLGEAGNRQYRIDGFSSENIFLFDTTDPVAPIMLTGAHAEANGLLRFQDQTVAPRRYFAAAQSTLSSRPVYGDQPSNLSSASGGIDYLVIGYGPFLPAVQPLIQLRVAQGLTVMSVDVQDVYDEFSHGLFDPRAIRDLLGHAAAEWEPVPDYVLLVGDGTIDFHDYLGHGWHNYLPAYPADVERRLAPEPAETASDNEMDPGEVLPIYMMGRLPVSSYEQTQEVVAKIVRYETAPDRGFWNRRMLFVADDDDYAGPFTKYSDQVYDSVAEPLVGERVYLSETPTEPHEYDNDLEHPAEVQAARAAIRSAFVQGRPLVTYMGHSSHSQWAQEVLIHRDNIHDLQNGDRLPVMLSMTCYTGAFHLPAYAPLDEALVVEPNGGAVASWAATGAGVATGHRHLAWGFLNAVQAKDEVSLGAAISVGLARLYAEAPTSRDLIDTYLLLGDPGMYLNRFTGTLHRVHVPQVQKRP
jgi:hypothetical protein